MHVSLTPTLEKAIQEKVASGFYNSASEVIREALRLLFEKDENIKKRFAELNNDIEIGYADFEAGNFTDGKKAMKRIKADL